MVPRFSVFFLWSSYTLLCLGGLTTGQNTSAVLDVGVILHSGTWVGKMSESCISMALSDFYSTQNYTTRLVLHTRDSGKDILGATSAALDLLKNVQVKAIIGPETSTEAKFLASISNTTQVPIISFSATSPSLSASRTPYFIRTTPADTAQIKAISLIIGAFGWKQVVPIYEDTDYGNGVILYIRDALQELNVEVPYRGIISPVATDAQIEKELKKLRSMQVRVFLVHMSTALGSQLFLKAKESDMMSQGYVWIVTDGITNLLDTLDSSVIESMQGVLGVKPYIPKSRELDMLATRWKRKFLAANNMIKVPELGVFGLWAYDTVWALAMAVNKIGETQFDVQKNGGDLTDRTSLPVSEVGPKLLDAISNTKFRGLSGDFNLVDGQLESPVFQIINIVGESGRELGFWTPDYGFSETLSPGKGTWYSASKDALKAVMWPGESMSVPKGWEITDNCKKLKIGVPVKKGFSDFVKVEKDPVTKGIKVTGFTIDVFHAVLEELPYFLCYEFIPFEGSGSGVHDDLIYQVYLQKFDAVVGDTTIVANRSLYVDFALPYTESGISMVVPVKEDGRRSGWVFLKPMTRSLWFMTAAIFCVTGFVVWALENRIDSEFECSQQAGTIFWSSFSTLVFAHKERVASNLERIVMMIWLFVALILTSSYTASLTSMLTTQHLAPTVADVNKLIKNGDYVGYRQGSKSMVLGHLKRLMVDETKLKAYNSPDEYAEALSKGSRNGGVATVFDETPYIRLFVAKSCNRYTMVGPTYRSDGFGFAFPKGSPLVSDVSRAVLNVTERGKLLAIEQAWFGAWSNCSESEGPVHSKSLNLATFMGLLLIVGIILVSALAIL